jgi:hypothetical protein
MLKQFRFKKTLALGNYDKKHQYETEEYEAVSDVSMEEAMKEVRDTIQRRLSALMGTPTVQIKTRE